MKCKHPKYGHDHIGPFCLSCGKSLTAKQAKGEPSWTPTMDLNAPPPPEDGSPTPYSNEPLHTPANAAKTRADQSRVSPVPKTTKVAGKRASQRSRDSRGKRGRPKARPSVEKPSFSPEELNGTPKKLF